jgi:hypothetical protein
MRVTSRFIEMPRPRAGLFVLLSDYSTRLAYLMLYNMCHMKKQWRNPVKDQPPKPETLAIEGDFDKFTADMKRLFNPQKEERKPTSVSSSPAPGVSS